MSDKSSIEWTDATWNPIRGLGPNRWMCQKISPGCDNCYASTMNHRWGGIEYPTVAEADDEPDFNVVFDHPTLNLPLKWRAPRRVFVCSMTDLFGEWVSQEWMVRVFEVMRRVPQHQFQVLTKRPARMAEFIGRYYGREIASFPGTTPLPNVWLGATIELDRYAWRASVLRACPAAIRFVSAEPLLGPLPSLDLTGIDWLIAGGESGVRHRACEADWARDLRDRSQVAGTAFFFKQWGGRTHAAGGRELDGRTWNEYPVPSRELAHV